MLQRVHNFSKVRPLSGDKVLTYKPVVIRFLRQPRELEGRKRPESDLQTGLWAVFISAHSVREAFLLEQSWLPPFIGAGGGWGTWE